MELKAKEIGRNELQEQFNQISNFVLDNWEVIYEGAVRCGLNIENDYYAPQRIEVREEDRLNLNIKTVEEGSRQTRLHHSVGLKYANGHKYNWDESPSEQDLMIAINDIQFLIDKAAEPIKSKIKISFS